MTPFLVNEGEKDICTTLAAVGWKIGLFKNNVTVDDNTVLGDLTDADFSGYTAGGSALAYGAATTNGSGQGQMTATMVSFSHNGGGTANTIYGWYIYNPSTSKLIKAANFDAPITMSAGTDVIQLTETHLEAGTLT